MGYLFYTVVGFVAEARISASIQYPFGLYYDM